MHAIGEKVRLAAAVPTPFQSLLTSIQAAELIKHPLAAPEPKLIINYMNN